MQFIQSSYWCFEISQWFFSYCARIGQNFLMFPFPNIKQNDRILLNMYHKSRMPLFDYLFTVRLLRNSIQFYTHHTGVLTSVDTFRDTALQVRGFFNGCALNYSTNWSDNFRHVSQVQNAVFRLTFTPGFLLRNSIQLYSHYTGVLGSVNGFFHNTLKLAKFF